MIPGSEEHNLTSVMKRFFIISFFLVTVFVAWAMIWILKGLENYADTPLSLQKKEYIFIIKPGENFDRVLKNLKAKKIIENPLKLKLFAIIHGYDNKIKAGEYLISDGSTAAAIIKMMVNGKIYLRKFTIPEGFNLKQMGQVLEKAGLCKAKNFIKFATDPEFAKKLGIEAPTLEGYLFPDTYFFAQNTDCRTIIKSMIKRFKEVFTDKWKKRAKKLNMSVHEVVTLASIIEKETGKAWERPIISSVFHNRLKLKMPLQSDPTVIYGIKDFNGNLTRKDIETKTPYNTYKIKGLPPGPIANPGKGALKAALWPARTEYLYFVAKGNKTHKFSKNLTDHNKAVKKYQIKPHMQTK